ncbi:hypothetical protein AU152_gp35 [Mycobacterium phage Phlei]|uniref:Uncharacterized protein n=1 Tax=Mycobacterium phage Phlei TaxID=1690684 RepID=A0A0N9BDM9_9CAUD|nr:hypothetical protein AU152_gp35 [Mycobacterium phage Phlei]ALA48148.1 hypothetical protein [Mycobacterium phage Phlei]
MKKSISDVINEVTESPIKDIVALAAAFIYVSDGVMEKYPNPSEAPNELVDFLSEVAFLAEELMSRG